MKMDVRTGRNTFLFFGIFFLLSSLLFSFATISTNVFPRGHELMMFATSISAFCNAYLYPQFLENDERTKRIKERGMFFSYFFILSYMIILMAVFQLNETLLNSYQTICLLASLTIMTVFLSFVVLAKRY